MLKLHTTRTSLHQNARHDKKAPSPMRPGAVVRSVFSLNCLLMFFYTGCNSTEEGFKTRFEHEDDTVTRDNLRTHGFFYDAQDELSQPSNVFAVHHGNSKHILQTDFLSEWEGHSFYSFEPYPTGRGLELMPAPSSNEHHLGVGLFPTSWAHTARVYLDPSVILLPVYTWRLYNSQSSPWGARANAGVMQYALDRAPGTSLPKTMYRPTGAQRVDFIWDQCNIQFRLAGHTDVLVPECFTENAWFTNNSSYIMGESCLSCPDLIPTEECDPEACGCMENGQANCTVAQYVQHEGHFVPNAINIYFVEGLSYDYEYPEIGSGALLGNACKALPWIFINLSNLWLDSHFSVLAHEIGHVLTNSGNHTTTGTLMDAGIHPNILLDNDQCQTSRDEALELNPLNSYSEKR